VVRALSVHGESFVSSKLSQLRLTTSSYQPTVSVVNTQGEINQKDRMVPSFLVSSFWRSVVEIEALSHVLRIARAAQEALLRDRIMLT